MEIESRPRLKWIGKATAVLLFGLVACNSGPDAPTESTPIDPATAGKIRVTVKYDGTVPRNKEINMQSAPACAKAHDGAVLDPAMLVKDGRLANAIVWIKSGFEKYVFAPPATPVEVDQIGCMFAPRVAVTMVHQPLSFVNSDAEAHNVHGKPEVVSGWNFLISRKGARREVVFDKPEVAVPVGCDIHPWMRAYVGIVSNPFYGVTPDDGTVDLSGVPPGTYGIGIWHEKLGILERQVELAASGEVSVEVTYPQAAQ